MKDGISKKKLLVMVLVLGLWGLVPAFGAIILIGPATNNGSFESPVTGSNDDRQIVPDSWTNTQPNIWPPYYVGLTHFNSYRPYASEGWQFLLMRNNSIYQTITETAIAGSIYTLAADYGNGASPGDNYTFKLDAVNPSNSGDIVNLINDVIANTNHDTWNTYSATSPAVSAAQNGWNLKVTVGVNDNWDTVDNVRLTVPEPAGLLLLGLGSLLALARQQKRAT